MFNKLFEKITVKQFTNKIFKILKKNFKNECILASILGFIGTKNININWDMEIFNKNNYSELFYEIYKYHEESTLYLDKYYFCLLSSPFKNIIIKKFIEKNYIQTLLKNYLIKLEKNINDINVCDFITQCLFFYENGVNIREKIILPEEYYIFIFQKIKTILTSKFIEKKKFIQQQQQQQSQKKSINKKDGVIISLIPFLFILVTTKEILDFINSINLIEEIFELILNDNNFIKEHNILILFFLTFLINNDFLLYKIKEKDSKVKKVFDLCLTFNCTDDIFYINKIKSTEELNEYKSYLISTINIKNTIN